MESVLINNQHLMNTQELSNAVYSYYKSGHDTEVLLHVK